MYIIIAQYRNEDGELEYFFKRYTQLEYDEMLDKKIELDDNPYHNVNYEIIQGDILFWKGHNAYLKLQK